ncbi:YlmH family RNA-binding protein [Fructobacillus ficulneus]|uniref:RNA-binding S4 domain-containing protein n=1 Tax=Fructobacillus ficulneus TaxID=157463 RepID=A0A0K8MHQ6_9LACO|nr:YlmH/Sll1252 family protein [Fructobacillus ficulneus]GAP00097.1 hypothetical protein FFIC_281030 [Fructobacillus ficulneus]
MAELNQIAQHFHDDERPFIKQVEDWLDQADLDYRLVLTHFLNPRQQYIVQTLVNQRPNLQMLASGIFEEAEAQRIVIAPDFFEVSENDFELTLLELKVPTKFVELRHKDVLGALVHSGIERSGFGDIVVDDQQGQVQVAIETSLVPFVQQEIERIGKMKTNWQSQSFDQALVKSDDGQETFLLVASLRLDAVLAAAFNLSRSKVQDIIDSGQVQVNWAVCQRFDQQILVKDVISMRRFGRISLESLSGQSKRDKIKAVFNIIHR